MRNEIPSTLEGIQAEDTGRLLNEEARAICEWIAKEDTPQGLRARALLALDGGATQMAAAEECGLTRGQVKYILEKYRERGICVFSDEFVARALQAIKMDTVGQSGEEVEEIETKLEKKAKKTKKKKKKKKAKPDKVERTKKKKSK